MFNLCLSKSFCYNSAFNMKLIIMLSIKLIILLETKIKKIIILQKVKHCSNKLEMHKRE